MIIRSFLQSFYWYKTDKTNQWKMFLKQRTWERGLINDLQKNLDWYASLWAGHSSFGTVPWIGTHYAMDCSMTESTKKKQCHIQCSAVFNTLWIKLFVIKVLLCYLVHFRKATHVAFANIALNSNIFFLFALHFYFIYLQNECRKS